MQARNLNELFAVLRRTWSYGYGFQAIRHAKERLSFRFNREIRDGTVVPPP